MAKNGKSGSQSLLVFIIILICVMIVAGIVTAYFQIRKGRVTLPQESASPLATSSTSNGYRFTVPEGYELISKNQVTETYGFDGSSYLTITKGKTIDANALAKSCVGNPASFCLDDGTDWGQETTIERLTLDGIPAQSFYIRGGIDNDFHIVQTTTAPSIELKMFVAGGGLERSFQEVLSSFQFVQ